MASWGRRGWRRRGVTRLTRTSRDELQRRLGRAPLPVRGSGRILAQTFWGQAWCRNLERYHDYANRLPRGRTYLRKGSVVDLDIERGLITALVAGSELYQVTVVIRSVSKKHWAALRTRCSDGLSSVVELLEGRLGDEVMQAVTEPRVGLFPEPRDIQLSCTCPDWAAMCKHVAAALYGVGLRLDQDPRLLFALRGVDPDELVGSALPTTVEMARERRLEGDLSDIFGVHIDDAVVSLGGAKKTAKKKTARKKTARKKTAKKKTAKKKTAKKKASPELIMTRQQLLARGVPASTIQGWLRRRVLQRQDRPGTYALTEEACECLEWYD